MHATGTGEGAPAVAYSPHCEYSTCPHLAHPAAGVRIVNQQIGGTNTIFLQLSSTLTHSYDAYEVDRVFQRNDKCDTILFKIMKIIHF